MSWRTQRIRLAAASGWSPNSLCHPAGAAADAELLDGAADRGGYHVGGRGV
jgi:hypothetical protein